MFTLARDTSPRSTASASSLYTTLTDHPDDSAMFIFREGEVCWNLLIESTRNEAAVRDICV
jgi:hypothetical protein